MQDPYRYKPVRFFFIAIFLTWTAWLGAAYFSYRLGAPSKTLTSVLELAGLFPPCGAALWMIFSSDSAELKRNFRERLMDIRLVRPSSIPGILLLIPAAALISVLLSCLLFGKSMDQLSIVKAAPFTAGLLPVPVMLFGAALLEEMGWKGYGMDSLRGERTFFKATLMYAALWAFWHIPLFFIRNYYHNMLLRTNPLFALNFFVSVFPAAFIINWLWYKNSGSILTAVLFHAVANLHGFVRMGQAAKCLETTVLIAIAAVIVGSNKEMFFEGFPARIGYFGRNGPPLDS